jgi:hypothetical protein
MSSVTVWSWNNDRSVLTATRGEKSIRLRLIQTGERPTHRMRFLEWGPEKYQVVERHFVRAEE